MFDLSFYGGGRYGERANLALEPTADEHDINRRGRGSARTLEPTGQERICVYCN